MIRWGLEQKNLKLSAMTVSISQFVKEMPTLALKDHIMSHISSVSIKPILREHYALDC